MGDGRTLQVARERRSGRREIGHGVKSRASRHCTSARPSVRPTDRRTECRRLAQIMHVAAASRYERLFEIR